MKLSRSPRAICYGNSELGAQDLGALDVSELSCRPLLRCATIAVVLIGLVLGGCGRKGPLDLPPGAAVSEPAGNPPRLGPNGEPVAAAPQPPPRKTTILDPLIN
jgi:predicted small lipoprotein YifL